MTHEEREAMRGLCEAATPGAWRVEKASDSGGYYVIDSKGVNVALFFESTSASFCAAARTALPELLGENETLFAEKLDLLSQLELMRLRAEAAEAALKGAEE